MAWSPTPLWLRQDRAWNNNWNNQNWDNQAWNRPAWQNPQPALNWQLAFDQPQLQKSAPNAKYKRLNALGINEKGKNKTSTVVDSRSKRTYAQKQWIRKDLVPFTYSLKDAASEVFFGQLAARIHGKTHSPKTKFNPDRRGVVSRIIGDNSKQTINLTNFVFQHDVQFTQTAKKDLMRALVFGVIIGDRDIAGRNIVVKRDPLNPKVATQVYGVDHEFGGTKPTYLALSSLKTFLPKVLQNPSALTDILVNNSNNWSAGKGLSTVRYLLDLDINDKMNSGISATEVQNEFADVAEKIAANDFQICKEIKEDMRKQLEAAGNIYSKSDIDNIIMPKVDEAIEVLKDNVHAVQEACDAHNPGLVNRMMHRIGAH